MDTDCFLCRKYLSKIFESRYFFAIYDDFPLRQGHILIIPIRHLGHLTLLTRAEFCDLHFVIHQMIKHMEVEFPRRMAITLELIAEKQQDRLYPICTFTSYPAISAMSQTRAVVSENSCPIL